MNNQRGPRACPEVELLSTLAGRLQAGRPVKKAFPALGDPLQRLFPGSSGAVYLKEIKSGRLETAVAWGQPPDRLAFSPEECWAAAEQPVQAEDDGPDGDQVERGGAFILKHVNDDWEAAPPLADCLCAAILADGEPLGALHIEKKLDSPDSTPAPDLDASLALAVARILGLGLSSLKLSEALQLQSMRDPLTGLFHHNYMEATLDRELSRAARGLSTLGVILIELDRFQEFRTANGFKASDRLLQAIGGVLQSSIRAEDIACRYQEDQFLLALPDSTLKITVQRARQIQEKVGRLSVESAGRMVGGLTTSIGVAFFPTHGISSAELIHAVSRALRRARVEGGDRTAISEIG